MAYKKGGKVNKFAKEEAAESPAYEAREQKLMKAAGYKKGGKVKKYARGGGIEQRGKTRGTMC